MSLAFWVTTAVVVVTPGTGVLYTITVGISRGARAGVIAAVGCTIGIVPHVVAAITGVAALLHTSAVAFQTLKYFGAAYLVIMAWRVWRDESLLNLEAALERTNLEVVFAGIVINLLNPKLTIFFFALLPQFVPGGRDGLGTMVVLSSLFMATTLVVFAGYGILASHARQFLVARPEVTRWLRKSFAAAFLGLGARLALTNR